MNIHSEMSYLFRFKIMGHIYIKLTCDLRFVNLLSVADEVSG